MKFSALTQVLMTGLLVACATTSWNWVQPGKSDAELKIDNRECTAASREERETYVPEARNRTAGQNLLMDSRWEIVVNQEMYAACMRGRGWQGEQKPG